MLLLLLRLVLLLPNPTILPPWVDVVLNHASIVKVCGPDCHQFVVPRTMDVLVLPGKLAAGLFSVRSAPETSRSASANKVRSLERM